MRRILVVCLAVVFLVGCNDAFRNNKHISKGFEDQHAAMKFERSTSPATLPARGVRASRRPEGRVETIRGEHDE